MKGFLFDENIPSRLTFTPRLPLHSSAIVGGNPSDSDIWQYARANELVIVSKDADFSNRMMVSECPPWVVHLRFGNLKRRDFHKFLARVWPQIETLIPEHKLVNVYIDRIEAVK